MMMKKKRDRYDLMTTFWDFCTVRLNFRYWFLFLAFEGGACRLVSVLGAFERRKLIFQQWMDFE